MKLGRALLGGLAVVIVAWFALAAREAREITDATNIATQSAQVTPAQFRRGNSLLDSAGTFNPDRQIDLIRAALYSDVNRNGVARRILEQVTTAEPENVDAWYQLAQASGRDYALEQLAFQHIAILHPDVH